MAESVSNGSLVRLTAERVWTGRELLRDAAVLVDGHAVRATGPATRVPAPTGAAEAHFSGSTLLPGLVDSHVHLTLRLDEDLFSDPAALGDAAHREWALSVARRVLAAGVTTIRDLGAAGTLAQRVRDDIVAGRAPGPRMVTSGTPITSPRGHLWTIGIECSGANGVRAAVDRVAAEGADLVKLIATGGSLTPGTRMGRAQFSPDVVGAAAAHAHGRGLRVAAHVHGTEGIEQVVSGGVDTVEHCSWMDHGATVLHPVGDLISEMRRREQVAVIATPAPTWIHDPHDWAKPHGALSPQEARYRRIARMWTNGRSVGAAGVAIAIGTDSFFGQYDDCSDLVHRAVALEQVAGWTPVEVLTALGPGGAAALGAPGRIGELVPGAYADVVAVRGDPTTRLAALWEVEAVYLAGRPVA